MPPKSNLRPRIERHFAFCALCRTGEPFDTPEQAARWMAHHARHAHGIFSPYAQDAARSVSVLYVAKSDNPGEEDPTGAFMQLVQWMTERGQL